MGTKIQITNKIIELLKSINKRLSNIENNTSYNSDAHEELMEIKTILKDKFNIDLESQYPFSYKNDFFNSTILIAVIAASSPLLPCLPPARSIACCWLFVVSMPKINGILYFRFKSLVP